MRLGACLLAALPATLLAGCVCAPISLDNVVQLPCCRDPQEQQIVNISTGVAPWQVRVPGRPAERLQVVPASATGWVDARAVPPWGLPSAEWVGPPGRPQAEGRYAYEVMFNVPRCPSARTVIVAGKFAADNHAVVSVPGSVEEVVESRGPAGLGFLAANVTEFIFTLAPGMIEGPQRLTVYVTNGENLAQGDHDGPTGLIVQATVNTRCTPR